MKHKANVMQVTCKARHLQSPTRALSECLSKCQTNKARIKCKVDWKCACIISQASISPKFAVMKWRNKANAHCGKIWTEGKDERVKYTEKDKIRVINIYLENIDIRKQVYQ